VFYYFTELKESVFDYEEIFGTKQTKCNNVDKRFRKQKEKKTLSEEILNL